MTRSFRKRPKICFLTGGNPYVHGSPSFDALTDINGASSSSQGQVGADNEPDVSGFLMGLGERMKRCRSAEDLVAVKAELYSVFVHIIMIGQSMYVIKN